MFYLIFLEILALRFLIYVIYLLTYSLIKGAPYAPHGRKRMETMFKLLNFEKGNKLVDLGSGDGRIVISAAKHGITASGFEINPLLYFISKVKLKMNGVKNADIYCKSYWGENLSSYSYITIYATSHIMSALQKKLLKELKPGTRVVSNHFKFPSLKVEKQLDDVYLYIF